MHANLAESIRTEDVASAAGLSAFHFGGRSEDDRHDAYRYLVMARVERVRSCCAKAGHVLRKLRWRPGLWIKAHDQHLQAFDRDDPNTSEMRGPHL